MPHRDSADETGPAAVPRPSLPRIEADLPKAPVRQLGEGVDLPGRQPSGLNLQRRGTEQPPASQDAEDRVPSTNSAPPQRPDRAGHVSRRPKYLPRGNDEDTPPRQATIIPGGDAKDSQLPRQDRRTVQARGDAAQPLVQFQSRAGQRR